MVAKLQPHVGIDALPGLLTVILKPVLAIAGHADVIIGGGIHVADLKRLRDFPAGYLAADHAETAGQEPHLQQRPTVARPRPEIDGATDGVRAVAQRIGPFIDFNPFIGQEVNGLEIRKPIGIAKIDSVDENIDAR